MVSDTAGGALPSTGRSYEVIVTEPNDDQAEATSRTESSWWHRGAEGLVVFLAQLVVAVYATWPLLGSMGRKAVSDLGDPLLSAWLFGWGAHQAVDAPLRLFDANMFFPEGLTLAFTENMLGLSLPVAPVFWITGNALLAENLALMLYIAASGLGAYLLVRELGVPRLLSFACATAYAVTPYRITQMGHPHVVGTHWLPFILLMLVRLSPRDLPVPVVRRRVAVLALLVALQTWSSLTGAAMAGVVIGSWAVWIVVRDRRRALRPLVRAGGATLVGLVLAVPVVLPYVVIRERHPGYRHPEAVALSNSAKPASYLAARGGGPGLDKVYEELTEHFADPAETPEKRLFPGAWLLLASVAGLVILLVRRSAGGSLGVLGLVISGFAFVFSLGPRVGAKPGGIPLPFFVFVKLIGGLTRVPARLGIVVPLGLVLVAGAGLTKLRPRTRTAVAAASLVFVLVEAAPQALTLVPAPVVTSVHRATAARQGAVFALPTTELDVRGAVLEGSVPVDAQHLYLSTAHFRPLVNGYAAYHPGSYWGLVKAVQDFPSEQGFAALKLRAVRTVVVQTDLVARSTQWPDVVARLRAWPGVTEIGSDRGVVAFDVTVAVSAAVVPVEVAAAPTTTTASP